VTSGYARMKRAVVMSVESSSSPGKFYRVWVDDAGPIFCECPASRFAKGQIGAGRKPCKHMRTMAESSDLATATALAKVGDLPIVEPRHTDRRVRFIEIQTQDNEGAWTPVAGNLSRFNQLEV
jgi:SWIM zinc finger